MNRSILVVSVFAVSLFVFAFPTQAQDNIVVDRVWATPCEDTTSVFVVVDNTAADHTFALTGASSFIARSVSIAEADETCATDAVENIIVPAGERLDLWEAGFAISVEADDDYEPGTPFNLTLTFAMLDDEMNAVGGAVEVMVGVPVLEEAPAESPLIVDAGSVWARPTVAMVGEGDDVEMMEMSGTSAVYMTIANPTESDDALVSATSDITDIVEIHETTLNENDVMQMRPVEAGVPIPAGETVMLQPGGYHVMLLNPAPMVTGDTIILVLEFESGESMSIAAPVEDRGMGMMMDMSQE